MAAGTSNPRSARGEARQEDVDLAAFEGGRALAVAEEGTVTWYAFKVDASTYGIFDTFETEIVGSHGTSRG